MSAGAYGNFLSRDAGEERLRAAYGENAECLRKIEASYDPDDFFRRNQSIEPLARTPARLNGARQQLTNNRQRSRKITTGRQPDR